MNLATSIGLLSLLLLSLTPASSLACDGCLDNDAGLVVRDRLEKLVAVSPAKRLELVRNEGICVKVADSGRKVPAGLFHWSQVEKPVMVLKDATAQKNALGKSFCKGEHAISRACPTIVLASDAPASTLLHEYLHVKQAARSKSWCALSTELWKREPTAAENRAIRDLEWDAHKILWSNRARLKLGLEDQIAVASETIEEAQKRRSYDSTAMPYLMSEKMAETFRKLLLEYQAKAK